MDSPHVQARIDLGAYGHNLRELRRATDSGARLMAVVKANAYGHGAVEISRAAAAGGVDWLGVARPAEAMALRDAGIDLPIMIFGRTSATRGAELAGRELIQAVFSLEMAEELSAAAVRAGVRLRTHVKIDSGMGRLGLPLNLGEPGAEAPATSRTVREILAIDHLAGLEVEGLFTHFANADRADLSDARRQLERFVDLDQRLRREGLEIPIRHAANSAALIGLPESHFEMVRPGISTYGLYPSPEIERSPVDLRPVMTLSSRVIQLQGVPAGTPISYGGTWRAERATTIATVAIGYADGLSRTLSNRGRMLIRGAAAPIVGRVCMDLTMVDVGATPEVEVGDEVIVFGRQGAAALSADDVAESAGTINYEVVSTVTARVPRVYRASQPAGLR